MATQIILEKLTGSGQSPSLPLFVHDDGTPPAELDVDTALLAVNDAAGTLYPETLFGFPLDDNPGVQRLSRSAWRITVHWRDPNLTALDPPGIEGRARFAAVGQRREVRWAPEVAAFDKNGLVGPPSSLPPGEEWHGAYGGLVNVQFSGGGTKLKLGAVIDPPEPNLFWEIEVDRVDIDPTFTRKAALLVGCVNDGLLTGGAYARGEIYLHSVYGQLVDKDQFLFEIGWSYKKNILESEPETRGEVTDIFYEGHHFVWEVPKLAVDRQNGKVFGSPKEVIVNAVHPYADLTALTVQPP